MVKKMRRAGLLITALSPFVFTGCGLFGGDDGLIRDRSDAYRQAEEIPRLTIPEGLDDAALGELYPIPEIPETTLLAKEAGTLRPQPISTNLLEEEVTIQSLGDRRWIRINRAPGEVWPRVRNILNTNAVPTAQANAELGTIETVWLEFDDDPLNFHRYRFSIEQGLQLSSTEIVILHASMQRDTQASPWPAQSMSNDREQTMAQFLASNLAGDLSGNTVSLLAQSIGGGAKVETVTPKDEAPYLLIKLEFERSWASVAYSVSRGGFTLVDQNRSEGVFYVNDEELENEDEPGFLGRLFEFSEGEDGAEEGRAETKVSSYRVSLTDSPQGIRVHIRSEGGAEPLERIDVLHLLKRIRANLA